MVERNKAGSGRVAANNPKVKVALSARDMMRLMATDTELASAVECVERNCGLNSGELLLFGHPALTPQAIKTLSGTSPEYQRHVLDRIRAGHTTPLKKTAACALVYETVSFREVISRMERALGGVR